MMQCGRALVQASSIISAGLESSSRQPTKKGSSGGAHTPVDARQMPLAQVLPIVHEGGVPSAQTKSFWIPLNIDELPP